MCWYNAYTQLRVSYWAIIIIFITGKIFFSKNNEKKNALIITTIIAFTCINGTTTETILNTNWSNDNHTLSAETYDYKPDDNTVEISPINEGFLIFTDNQKKHSPHAIFNLD
jgi:hypothetical protein